MPPIEPNSVLFTLFPQYLENGYFDGSGNLRVDYVRRERIERIAQRMSNDWPRSGKPTHQLRRFFQHCRAIEAKLRAKTSSWSAEEAAFRQIDVAAADAFFKSERKIPLIFHDFIRLNVDAVRSEKDFLKGFLPHFEALIGFGSQFFKDGERTG